MTSATSLSSHLRRRLLAVTGAVLSFGLIAGGMAIVSALPAAAKPSAGISLSTLEVENRTEPLGIDVAKPRFSWVTESDARDVTQTSYRIRVATSEAQLASADAWDSGVVASDSSTAIEYGGAPLKATTDYVWRVDIATTAGEANADSTFSTGMFAAGDWADSTWIGNARASGGDENNLTFTGAKWIWTPEPGAPYSPGDDRAFRKTVASPAGRNAAKAEIMITADDSYKLWLNNKVIGQTKGAENEWQGSKRYVVELDASKNVFAVRTTNGANTPSGLLAVIRITFDDGSTTTFTTDDSWKAVKDIPAGFQTSGFDDSAWPAAAIQATYGSGPWGAGVRLPTAAPTPAPLLRKEFTVDSAVTSAKIYVAAGGYANVSLNGSPINDDILSPGFTDYDDHAQYTVTDLTDQLRPGANALGVELGRGFYGMTNPNVWWWEKAPWHDDPVVRAVLRVTYADDTTKDVVTNDSWKIHDGPVIIDDLYGGETHDASKVQPGFDTAGFSDSSWVKASEVAGPKGELINQQQQPIRVTEELAAESITKIAEDDYVVKFPRVMAGTVRFTAQGEAGATIRAQYGEKLLDSGRPNFSNNGGFGNGFQTDRFILAGTGKPETWAGNFSYKGFQYIEVTGWPGGAEPPLEAFTALVMHTDAAETGSFTTSNDIMNRTHRAVVDTLLNNLHGIPSDTPMFEKNGWTGDASVGAEMFLMNLDTQNLFEKWIGDINDSRDADGAPYVIAPSSADWGAWGVAPPWHSAYILIPSWLNQYGGDIQVLDKYYDGMKKYVDLEYGRSPGGIVPESRLGDWVSPEASPAGGNAPEDIRVSATAYLYTMLTSMQKTATQLGKSADAAAFAARAAVVKDAFNNTFLDTNKGLYRGVGDAGYRQTHNALALAFGLAPDEAMGKRVAASLAADVVAKGNKLNTGSLGTKYLLPVLTDYGYEDLAYKVAVQTAYPSWGYLIENGATSMWEHWSLDARSYGHYFLGTVDDWFYHYVGGIRSSEVTGYRDVTIAPAITGQLDWAKTKTQTPFGPISTDWKKTGDALTLKAHIPVGSTATVHVPAPNSWAVTEGGKTLDQVDGVRSVSQQGDDVLVTIGSGDYSFAVDPKAGDVGTVLESIQALQAQADAERAAAGLNQGQYDELSALIALARSDAEAALGTVSSADATETAKKLAPVIADVDDIDDWLTALDARDATATALQTKTEAVRSAVDAALSGLLHISASATLDAPAYKPGTSGTLTASVDNGGDSTIKTVTAAVSALDESWKVTPPVTVADSVAPGASGTAKIEFTVPLEQLPGEVPASVHTSYRFSGVDVGIDVPVTVKVDSPVSISATTLAPLDPAPGGSSTLTATMHNDGTEPAVGHLNVVVPDGWVSPLPTADVVVPAGEDVTLTVPVFVPIGADHSPATVTLTAQFAYSGVIFASKPAELSVALPPISEPVSGYDHVDLGNAASEQAHNLTASPESGTNTEAGLTRRYANQMVSFTHFEFDTAVEPAKPFMVRAIETYDKPQTKKYKIFVDDQEVTERLFTHTTGLGTETYEFMVDAKYATDSSVRIRFQYGDDHSFYDPSIADVWTLPVPNDTVAPQVVAHADPATPDRTTGWYTKSPVAVSLVAQDDRNGDVGIDFALGAGTLAAYSKPIILTDDGLHDVSFRATDAAGNESPDQKLVVKIDTTKPSTQAAFGDEFEAGTAQNAGTVAFTAHDATSGVATTSYRVNAGAWQQGDAVTVDHAGEFTVDYFSTDAAGNVEATKSISGNIVIPDLTPPSVSASISHGGDNGWYLDGAAVTITADDDDSGIASIEYQLADGGWRAYGSPVALPEGESTVQFRARDKADNVSAVSSITATVDGIAPTVWGWLSGGGRVTSVAQDQGSGPGTTQFTTDGDTWFDSLSALVAVEPAPASVDVRARDVAGNVSEPLTLERSATPTTLSMSPGSRLLIEASGFEAGQSVRVELHSTPVTLALVTADNLGVITTLGTVPEDLEAGEHTIVFIVDSGTSTGGGGAGGPVTIPTTVIADTGTDLLPMVLFGSILLLLGGWFVAARRRTSVLVR